MYRQLLRMVPMFVVMGSLFVLSHQPSGKLLLPPLVGFDKCAHAAAYGILAVTVLLSVPPQTRSRAPVTVAVLVIAVCLFYGLTDELHQYFIPGREAGIGDIIADGAGAAIISLIWFRRSAT